jgi:molybdopterin molybdotransferase
MALLSVSEALERILDQAAPLEALKVDLLAAPGRTLAAPIHAHFDNPPFDASAMDGYAVRADDIAELPATLELIGESGAGSPYSGRVGRGQAVRILTGAPVPRGADTVVIQENVSASETTVTIRSPAAQGANIRRQGEDFAKDALLLDRGRRLTARDILLAAASGNSEISVVRKPVIAILSTGDELVEPGLPLAPGQIPASNGYALAAMIGSAGGEAKLLGIARDNLTSLDRLLRDAETADILLTIGGASVGDRDLVRPALEAAGAKLDFYKVAMRPGKPLFFGRRRINGRKQLCLGLPGNPVSAIISARIFLVPLITRMLGRAADPEMTDAILAEPIAANGPRQHFMRALLDRTHSPPRVAPLKSQDSGLVTVLQRADCLLVVAPDAPPQPAGTPVKILSLDI